MSRFDNHQHRRHTEIELAFQVRDQADTLEDGWIELEIPADEEKPQYLALNLKLPRIPFERWIFGATNHRFTEWKNICPLGMKMMNDDRNHSDWWLSTGIPMEYSYGKMPDYKNDLYGYEPGDPDYIPPDLRAEEFLSMVKRINEAVWDYRYNVAQKRERGSIFLVSPNKDKEVQGRISFVNSTEEIEKFVEKAQRWKKAACANGEDIQSSNTNGMFIAVVPDCSVLYDAVIHNACAIITQVGSKAAHLVKVAREDDIPVILNPDAFKMFYEDEKILIKNNGIRSLLA
jgi:phosphohistidine swiveling domain-containing protein